jgi:MFS family permease
MGIGSVRKRDYMRGNFLLLFTSTFIFGISIHLLVPMLPAYVNSYGVTETELGFIIGLMALMVMLFNIPVGKFIDHRGYRGMLLFGILFLSIAPLAYTLCSEAPHFIIVRLIHGSGFAAYMVTATTMIVNIAPKNRMGEVMGIYSVAYLGASAAGPAISGVLLSVIGDTGTFYASELIAIIALVLVLCIRVPKHIPSPEVRGSLKNVLGNRNLTTASLVLFVLMLPQGVMHSFFPLYALEQGIGYFGLGLFFAVYALSMGGVRPFVGALSDRIGRVAVAVPFMLISGAGVVSFSLLGDIAGFLAIGAVLGAGIGAAHSTLSALSVDTMKPELRGQAVAVSGTSGSLGVSMGSMAMGPVVLAGGYSASFIATGAAIFVGTAAFLSIRAVWKKEEKVYT